MKNWYCKPASEAEAIEIVERAVANGAVVCDLVKGMSGGVWRYYWNEYSHWGVLNGYTYTHATKRWNGAEQLTTQQVREQFPLPGEQQIGWNGEGLPPVGVECEYYDKLKKRWVYAFIVAHDIGGEEAIWRSSKYGGQLYYGTPSEFRPLRTEREKWIERAIEAVGGKQAIISAEVVLGKIYDNMIKEAE